MSLSIPDIVQLFQARGHEQYDGEPVTQLQHALQTATFAEQAGAGSELISACLLHDIGHLLHDFGPTPSSQGLDDLHQYRSLPFLRGLFGDATLDPMKLHVDAKRYLCAIEPAYHASLSEDSQRSLQLQGGIFNAAQAHEFIALPHAADAVALRRWDDLAKDAAMPTPDFAHFVRHLESACEKKNVSSAPRQS